MSKQGFTLVEMGIVIVIIGLLVGGILAGQNLIRAAELKTIATDFERYKQAVTTFQDQYYALPGDMPFATDLWGVMSSGTCPNATGGSGTETCSGNGDGRIGFNSTTTFSSRSVENFMFWQHLSNAGLIKGSYTGLAGPDRSDHAINGENTPESRVDNNATWAAQTNNWGSSIIAFELPNTMNNMVFGGSVTAWNGGPVLTTEEAWNIDTKLDDGHATQGDVWAVGWDTCTPATGATDYQDYDLTVSDLQCGLVFLNPFLED